jgi:hypothetical protein
VVNTERDYEPDLADIVAFAVGQAWTERGERAEMWGQG